MPERDPRATSQPPMRGNLQTTPGAPPQPGVNPAPPPAAAPSAAPAAVPGPSPAAAPANGASVAAPSVTPGTPPPQSVSPTPPLAAPPVAAAPAAQPVAGLPADAPKLAISGGVYSNNRAQRMLIVNGQVFNEGSEIGPGVVLEEIKAKTALLRFRGSRYTVSY
jgi:general secretion pathway protein B